MADLMTFPPVAVAAQLKAAIVAKWLRQGYAAPPGTGPEGECPSPSV